MHYYVLVYITNIVYFCCSKDFGENKQTRVLLMVALFPLIKSATPYCIMACQSLKRYVVRIRMYT